LHLQNNSPAINAGTAIGAPTDDFDGDPRPLGGGFDMGYDEVICASSTAPLSISGISTICNGESTTLTLAGGSAGTGAIAKWYSGTCGGTPVGTGNSISVSPMANTTYFVRYEGACNTTDCASQTVGVNTLSTAPLSISGVSTICNGGNTTLTLVGGSAGTGATAKWYSGTCGGTPVGMGNSITVSPSTNTTYFVRYEGTCNTTACASQTVGVNTLSIAPLSISGISTICSGGSTTLTLVGGSAGTNATAKWYSGSCGGTPVGMGNSITVSPSTNTTYFVRYEGACNTTDCASQTVGVNTLSTAPLSISGVSTICSGGSTTLTLVGGSAGTGATAKWYSSSCGGTPVGMGSSITVSPTTSTTYFVRYEGICNTTACASQLITINPSISVDAGPACVQVYSGYNTANNCTSLTATASGNGSSGYIYAWRKIGSTTVIATSATTTVCPTAAITTYSVTATKAGCTATDVVDVKALNVTCEKNKILVCHNGFTICIAQKDVASHLAHGDKLGKCNANDLCGNSPSALIANQSVHTDNDKLHIHMYPNPAYDKITVQLENVTEGVTQIEVLDLTGKVVKRMSQNVLEGFNELTLDIQNLSNGLYLVKVKDSSNQEAVLKVSKM
jgi:Secretion system C-terminal sorting domain/Ig-like domain CHU_C associated